MNVVGMLRVKNEARWIGEVLDSLKGLCSSVHVLDDHSTDATEAIAAARGAELVRSPFEGIDEKRDKDYLLAHIRMTVDPDWVLLIDGDEVLEPAGKEAIRRSIASGIAPAYTLQVVYLWDRPDQIRTDGIYRAFRRPSLFHAKASVCRFRATGRGGNFHCSSIPADLIGIHDDSPARLKHYGYMTRGDRIRKWHFYTTVDAGNVAEDNYRHMVLGDVDEFPAGLKTRHAGPLQLEPYIPATLS